MGSSWSWEKQISFTASWLRRWERILERSQKENHYLWGSRIRCGRETELANPLRIKNKIYFHLKWHLTGSNTSPEDIWIAFFPFCAAGWGDLGQIIYCWTHQIPHLWSGIDLCKACWELLMGNTSQNQYWNLTFSLQKNDIWILLEMCWGCSCMWKRRI